MPDREATLEAAIRWAHDKLQKLVAVWQGDSYDLATVRALIAALDLENNPLLNEQDKHDPSC